MGISLVTFPSLASLVRYASLFLPVCIIINLLPAQVLEVSNYKVLGTFFKEFVSGYKVVFKDIGAGI